MYMDRKANGCPWEQEQSKIGPITSFAKCTIVRMQDAIFSLLVMYHQVRDESDVHNLSGSEVVYLQEVLRIPGVINTALHWNIRQRSATPKKHFYPHCLRLKFKVFCNLLLKILRKAKLCWRCSVEMLESDAAARQIKIWVFGWAYPIWVGLD